jgi:hypothetical protein
MHLCPRGLCPSFEYEETAHMRTLVSLAATAALFVSALFGAVGEYWP